MQRSDSQQDGRPTRKSTVKRGKKAAASDSIDIMTHEEVRIMSINRQSGTPMDMETQPIREEAREDSDIENYDMGDLKKDTQNKDRLSEVINQLLLKNVLLGASLENQPKERLRCAFDQSRVSFGISTY